MTARIDEDAAFGWRYIDDSHRQQGPFSNMQMRMWFIEDRYRVRMKPNLYVQRTSDRMAAMQRIGMPLIGHGLVSHAGFEQLDLVFRGHARSRKYASIADTCSADLTSTGGTVVSESFSSSITGTRGAAAGNEAPVAPLGVSTGMPLIGAVTRRRQVLPLHRWPPPLQCRSPRAPQPSRSARGKHCLSAQVRHRSAPLQPSHHLALEPPRIWTRGTCRRKRLKCNKALQRR